jgi:hypothetical protein
MRRDAADAVREWVGGSSGPRERAREPGLRRTQHRAAPAPHRSPAWPARRPCARPRPAVRRARRGPPQPPSPRPPPACAARMLCMHAAAAPAPLACPGTGTQVASCASLQGCLMHELRHARLGCASKAFPRCAGRQCSGSGGRSAQQALSPAEARRPAGTPVRVVGPGAAFARRHMQPRAGQRRAPAARWRPASARAPARPARRASAPPDRPARRAARPARPRPRRRLRHRPARGSHRRSSGHLARERLAQRCLRERGLSGSCARRPARRSAFRERWAPA